MKSVSLVLMIAAFFISLGVQAQTKKVHVRYATSSKDIGGGEESAKESSDYSFTLDSNQKAVSHKLYQTKPADSIRPILGKDLKYLQQFHPLLTKADTYTWKTPTGSVTRVIGDMPYADLLMERIDGEHSSYKLITLQPSIIETVAAPTAQKSQPAQSKTSKPGKTNN